MPGDPSSEEVVSTINLMPTIRGMVRTWRIHFEEGINPQDVENDMFRILTQLLHSPNGEDEVWPEETIIFERWEKFLAER